MEKAQGMRLQHLRVVRQAPLLDRCRKNFDTQQSVARLGTGQNMAHRANTTHPCHQARHLMQRPALADFLETAKLGHVELGRLDLARVVHPDGNFGVAFDPGHWMNQNALGHYPNLFNSPAGSRPSSRSTRHAWMPFAEGGQPVR